MNGLAVLISWDQAHAAAPRVENMLLRMSHRGAQRLVHRLSGLAALGTTQPANETAPIVSLERAGLSCVADARLDNRDELQAIFGQSGAPSLSDAELLLLGYERWGTGLAEHLVGDFSFAIWDERSRTLYAARDPFGARTLFYRLDDSGCLLASEVEPLLDARGQGAGLEEEAILDYLLHDHRCRRETFYRGVFRVQPGHWLVARAGSVQEQRYWHPPRWLERRESEREYAAEFRKLFLRAVDRRLDRDCPTIAQLSGGLDSSSIVAMAEELYRQDNRRPPLVAASAVYPGLPCDESAFLDAIERSVRFRIARWDGKCEELFDPERQPGLMHPGDESGNESDCEDQRLARKFGARGILSGFGGDQLLFERGVYRDLAAAGRWLALMVQTTCASYSTQSRFDVTNDALRATLPQPLRRLYRSWRPVASAEPPAWLSPRLRERWRARVQSRGAEDRAAFTSHCQAATWQWLTNPQLWWSLEMQVLSAARRGLEMRFPFLDSRLARFVLAIPYQYRLPAGRMKRLLRLAMKGLLPSTVLNRRRVTTFESLVHANFPRTRPRLEQLFSDGAWLSGCYLDRAGIQGLFDVTATERASSPEAWGAMSNLLDIAQLEVWLRGLHNRGVLQLQGAIH